MRCVDCSLILHLPTQTGRKWEGEPGPVKCSTDASRLDDHQMFAELDLHFVLSRAVVQSGGAPTHYCSTACLCSGLSTLQYDAHICCVTIQTSLLPPNFWTYGLCADWDVVQCIWCIALPFHLKCHRCKTKNHQMMSLVVVVVYSLVVSSCLMLSLQPRAKLRSLNPSSQRCCQLHLHCPHLPGPARTSLTDIKLAHLNQSLDHCQLPAVVCTHHVCQVWSMCCMCGVVVDMLL